MSRRSLAAAERPGRSLPISQRVGRLIGQTVFAANGGGSVSAAGVDPGATGAGSPGAGKSSDVWGYYDVVGESWFQANFLGACFSRIVLRPGWMGDDDKPGPLFDDEGNVADGVDVPPALVEMATRLIRALRSKPGGASSLLKAVGQNMAQAGDLYLVGEEDMGLDGRGRNRRFDALSTEELRPITKRRPDDDSEAQRYQRMDRPSGSQGKDLPEGAFVLRIWQPHPRFRRWPDSPMRPLITTMEGMRLLTLEQLAQARSRLKGPGIYWIADDIDIPTDDDQTEEEALTLKMVKVFSAAIGDPGSASANVPIVIRAPAESIQNGVRLDNFDLSSQQTIERRAALVDDFARGVPLPPEVIKGHSQTTFANAFSIDEATMRIYVASPLELFCGHLSSGYLQPQLLAEFPDEAETIERMVVWYDDSNLVTHPNRAAGAATAVGTERQPNFVISLDASRRYQGFTRSDAPDDEEIETRMARSERLNARVTLPGLETAADNASAQEGGATSDASATAVVAPDAPLVNGQASLATRLAHAADYAADRAIERLHARLVERVKRDASMTTEQRNQVLSSDITAARLGPETVRRLVGGDLWAGEFSAFEVTARRWAVESHHASPDLVAARSKLMVEKLATERLFKPSTSVTPAQLAGLVTG